MAFLGRRKGGGEFGRGVQRLVIADSRRAMGVGESSAALREGSIDAFVWSGGLPTGAITDLATTDDIVLLPLDRYVPKLNERYGEAYQESEVEDGEYPGVPATPTIAVPNLLMVRSDMDEALAHDLIKLMFDHKAELAEVTMKPANDTEMAGEDAQRMQKLLDALEGLDDVQDVYTTAALS